MRFRDTGTRIRGVVVAGDYGAPSRIDWTEGTLTKVDYPCEFQPDTTSEDVQQQQRTETYWRLFVPADADIVATDRWRFLGVDYDIVGDVEQWRHRGVVHHLEVRVLRVSGG
jgi:hypothetical protein